MDMVTATRYKTNEVKRLSLYSTVSCRFFAFLIDSTLLLLVQSIATYHLVGLPEQVANDQEFLNFHISYLYSNPGYLTRILNFNMYFIFLHWLYYAGLESSKSQATIGKMAMGLRVTDTRGRRISFLRATLRFFTKSLTGIILVGSGFLLAYITRRKQALHDLAARTLVLISN